MSRFIPAVGSSFEEQQAWAEHQSTLRQSRSAAEKANRDLEGGDFYLWLWQRDDPEGFGTKKDWWSSSQPNASLEAQMTQIALTDKSGVIDQFIDLGETLLTAEVITTQQFLDKLAAIGIPNLESYLRQRFSH